MPLCDVHGCPKESVGEYDGSNFCREHIIKMMSSDELEEFDEMCAVDEDARSHNSNPHPLLNPDSTHYQMVDGTEAIQHMEMMFSNVELMHWAKITAMKYRLRIGNKDDVLKEAKKIETYEAYYKYMSDRVNADAR